MKLYRYLSLQAFCELLYNKELTFKQPKSWPDQYEGYHYRLLETDEGKRKIDEIISRKGFSEEQKEGIKNVLRLIGNSLYCACFSKNRDAEVMWNAYGYNKQAVMIEVDTNKLPDSDIYPSVCTVEYDLENGDVSFWEENLSKIGIRPGFDQSHEALAHKRKCFSYENEVRLIILDISNPDKRKLKYPVDDISIFITGVMVHPLATDEYTKMIGTLCNGFSLHFLGKSKVYEMP